jgi:hypothetical protein
MKICILGLVLLCAAGCTTVHITGNDRAQVAAMIRLETDEPMLMINPESEVQNALRVNTGYSFKASGKSFVLRRIKGGWVIIWRGSWDS